MLTCKKKIAMKSKLFNILKGKQILPRCDLHGGGSIVLFILGS